MTPVDDLAVGMYVAVVAQRSVEDTVCPSCGVVHAPSYAGVPLRILAISLPFISVRDYTNKCTVALDMRDIDVKAVTRDYVKAMHNIRKRRKKHAQEQSDKPICPRCEEEYLVQRRSARSKTWAMMCPNCGFEQEKTPSS